MLLRRNTGPPKAVMITHDNATWTAQAQLSTMPRTMDYNDCIISYLPLSHIAAQMLDMYCCIMTGTQVWFAQPDALRGSLGATLKYVRPTVFFGVPRVWEKIYDKMQMVAKESKGLKKKISTWAKGRASQHWDNHQFGGSQKSPFMYGLASKLLGKVRLALGLDRVRHNFCIWFQTSETFTLCTPIREIPSSCNNVSHPLYFVYVSYDFPIFSYDTDEESIKLLKKLNMFNL